MYIRAPTVGDMHVGSWVGSFSLDLSENQAYNSSVPCGTAPHCVVHAWRSQRSWVMDTDHSRPELFLCSPYL